MNIVGIRYINLKKNKWRRFFIFKMLEKTKYKFRRIPGVVYSSNDYSFSKYIQFGIESYLTKSENLGRAPGVIGCWMAHVKALESISSREGITVIMEDDFAFGSFFFPSALSMIRKFNTSFDVIFFDTRGVGPSEKNLIYTDIFNNNLLCGPNFIGSHCLFVNNRSVEKILRIVVSSKVKDYDGFLLNNKDIDTYVFYTRQSMCLNVGSNLDNTFDFFKALKSFFKWLRLYFN